MSSQFPTQPDPFGARATLRVGDRDYTYFRLEAAGAPDLARLPYTVKVRSNGSRSSCAWRWPRRRYPIRHRRRRPP